MVEGLDRRREEKGRLLHSIHTLVNSHQRFQGRNRNHHRKTKTRTLPTGHRRQLNIYSTLVPLNFIEKTWKQRWFNQCVPSGCSLNHYLHRIKKHNTGQCKNRKPWNTFCSTCTSYTNQRRILQNTITSKEENAGDLQSLLTLQQPDEDILEALILFLTTCGLKSRI